MAGVVRYQITVGDNSEFGSVAWTEHTRQEIVVATATTDAALNFGGVTTADVFFLKSDQAITLNLQADSGTDITVDANKPVVLTGTAITAAYVSNASGSSANIVFEIWGA